MRTFNAIIERDPDSGLYVGRVPGWPGAHSLGASLDELERNLRDVVEMLLRRLSGKTDNTAPVLTLITQFGGGKTHTLTALYHLAKNGKAAAAYPGVSDLVREAGVAAVPQAPG